MTTYNSRTVQYIQSWQAMRDDDSNDDMVTNDG